MKRLALTCVFFAFLIPIAAPTAVPEEKEAAIFANLKWRSIGPANMGGRVSDIVGIPVDPYTFYVAGADGGIFKTTNGGTTFEALFQDQEVLSIGAIAIAPSDPNVIWVGTGEGDPRNSASFGNGVYRSTDAGKTWKHLGLADTERIKRIRVHPKDPDTAYVAALGHAWGANEERGVFKTIDGGKTWNKVLYIDKDTGCSDIDLDPENPRILYAGMYNFRRRPWRFDSGGGATALYRTKDAGESWQKLTNGLPKNPMDRIGVAISRSHPETVYMITETKTEGVGFGGPQAIPGEYTITLKVGSKQLSKKVQVGNDPRVKITQAELEEQLTTALELRELSSTVNRVVGKVDDLTRQLTALTDNLRRNQTAPVSTSDAGTDGNSGNGVAQRTAARAESSSEIRDIQAAIDELKKLRANLVREAQFSYRYPPKLREETGALLSSVSNPIAPPTEPQKLRLRELKDETAKAVADLNGILNGSIKRINEELTGQPHVMTGGPIQ